MGTQPRRNNSALHLRVLPDPFFIIKLKPGESIPPCVVKSLVNNTGRFFSLTRTNEEVSLVGEAAPGMSETCKEYSGWMCIKIAGPMDFGLTGILADFTAPLKEARVPVFALSTWNTDYILVPAEMIPDAVNALEKEGWVFVDGTRRQARL